jgi:hypothetical protein
VAHLKCPRCGLLNPESAEHCDCNFAFKPTAVNHATPGGATQLVLHGKQGKTLYASGDAIRIEKQGLITGKREKTILIRNVTSVEVKKPGGFVGFIQFSIAGGNARDGSYTMSGGAFDAVKDENSVVFNGSENYETALKIKAYVESWSPIERQRPTVARKLPVSAADEIRELKALLDDGILTEEEFARKKKQLLRL